MQIQWKTILKKGIHRVIQFGLIHAEYYSDSLNQKYNFFYEYDYEAGCEVNDQYMKGVNE